MSADVTPFGDAVDGGRVERVRLTGGALTASFITYGAVLQDLRLEGHGPALVLGFPKLADYLDHSRHFGATAGPCANRIAGGTGTVDGRPLRLDINYEGRHHLHGGAKGTGKLVWAIADAATDRARFELHLAEGHMGYPGPLHLSATFRLAEPATLIVVYEARTQAPTLVNLAHHSYFNLSGEATVLDHRLEVAADIYLPVDDGKIPLGEPASVAGTVFDFRTPRAVGEAPDGEPPRIDHNYCLADARGPLRRAARLVSPRSGVALEVSTTEPGLQVYDGHELAVPVPGHDGMAMRAHAGIALEAQVWPDSINRPAFPSAALRPGETYRQETRYAFAPVP